MRIILCALPALVRLRAGSTCMLGCGGGSGGAGACFKVATCTYVGIARWWPRPLRKSLPHLRKTVSPPSGCHERFLKSHDVRKPRLLYSGRRHFPRGQLHPVHTRGGSCRRGTAVLFGGRLVEKGKPKPFWVASVHPLNSFLGA